MSTRRELITHAIAAALRVRREVGTEAGHPLCVYDLAHKLGIDVRFLALPSMEGMFDAETRTIFVCSLRPAGRQAFTAAHELGHCILEHGTHISEFVEPGQVRHHPPQEVAANAFAGALLMPKSAVLSNFSSRGWVAAAPTSSQVYVVAGAMGVGYTTLINHLRFGINVLDQTTADSLLREGRRLSRVRARLAGQPVDGNLVVVDEKWSAPFVDVVIGDILLVPPDVEFSERHFTQVATSDSVLLINAASTGCSEMTVGNKKLCARVSSRDYVGRATYRHEPEDPSE